MDTLHLEVNDAGGWRRVMSFRAEEKSGVQRWSAPLLQLADSTRIRARIIAPGTTAPLMTWTQRDGWKEWRS